MTKYYTVEQPAHPWGDYYDILMHGMTDELNRRGGLLELERTGPFMPPISMPSNVLVVTDSFRTLLKNAGLLGLEFQPVIKKRIVRSEWHTWDKKAEEPARYPRETEPENYILGHRHSATIAAKMGDLWEVVLKKTARVLRTKSICTRDDICLLTNSLRGEDLFRADGVLYIYATEKARQWFEFNAGEYIAFEEARTQQGGVTVVR